MELLLWLFFPPGAGSCGSGSWEENDKVVSRQLQIRQAASEGQSRRVETRVLWNRPYRMNYKRDFSGLAYRLQPNWSNSGCLPMESPKNAVVQSTRLDVCLQ